MSNPSSPAPFSTEIRDLVIRLDQKVSDGFHQINSKLDAMERRADGHDQRLGTLEHRTTLIEAVTAEIPILKTDIRGLSDDRSTARGSVKTWMFVGPIVGAALMWIGTQAVSGNIHIGKPEPAIHQIR